MTNSNRLIVVRRALGPDRVRLAIRVVQYSRISQHGLGRVLVSSAAVGHHRVRTVLLTTVSHILLACL